MALARGDACKGARRADLPPVDKSERWTGIDELTDSPDRPEAARHITLTSHPRPGRRSRPKIVWGAATPAARGPVIGTLRRCQPAQRDRRPFRLLCALPGARGRVGQPQRAAPAGPHRHRAGGGDRAPSAVGRRPRRSSRSIPTATSSARRSPTCSPQGWDIRPTIAVTRARLTVPELKHAVRFERAAAGRADRHRERRGQLHQGRARAGLVPAGGRRALRRQRGEPAAPPVRADRRHVPRARDAARPQGVPAADRRPDRLHLRRRPAALADPARELACRVHDECNGSDVFGSDICTCRPYLVHGIEVCIATAQAGGAGLIVYNRKEGRALGEVTKFLVYNARKRQTRRRPRGRLLRAHRVRRRRPGRALPGADAGRAALARHHPDPPPGLDEQPEIRRDGALRHRGGRARADPGRSDPRGRAGSRWTPRRPPATTRETVPSEAELAATKGRALEDYGAS